MNVKSLTTTSKIATIKLHMDNELKVRAVYALLGGYNEVARNVDLVEFHDLEDQFKVIVTQLMSKMAD